MSHEPELSIVIPWRNRNEIALSLARNQHWLQSDAIEALVVNCSGDSEQLRGILIDFPALQVRQINVPAVKWNKPLAVNLGVFFSRAPTVFALDTDVFLKVNPLTELLPLIAENTFVTIARLYETEKAKPLWSVPTGQSSARNDFLKSIQVTNIMDFEWADGNRTRIAVPGDLSGEWRTGVGQMMVRKANLLKIEGYNSELELWGWDDNDVELRLKRALGLEHIETSVAFHLTHGDKKRALQDTDPGIDFRWATGFNNMIRTSRRYTADNFLGTYSSDISSWAHRTAEISPRRY
jgi:hypothetical protein